MTRNVCALKKITKNSAVKKTEVERDQKPLSRKRSRLNTVLSHYLKVIMIAHHGAKPYAFPSMLRPHQNHQ